MLKIAEIVELEGSEEYHEKIRSMLLKQEQMWEGQIGEINVTEQRVHLLSEFKLFKSALYWSEPN